MRVLLDSCVWGPAAEEVRAAGHDVSSVRDWGGDPGDEAILRRSVEENRILVTLDKDFGNLVFALGHSHRGIVRLVGIRACEHGRTMIEVLKRFGSELQKSALIVVETDRVRIRVLDADDG